MRRSKALARIRNGDIVRLCCLGHYIPPFVAHAARAGYDCIWLDLEHRGISSREIEALLMQCHLQDIDCMVRPPTREKARLYRYLEDGAAGLMIPHVASADQVRELVAAVKFPPLGNRGVDNAGLDSGYHSNPDNVAYAEAANRETFLAVQIETPEAVENCEEIVSVDGLDAVFVGPGDLGLRLTLAGDSDGTQLEAAIGRIARACAQHGKSWGSPAMTPEVLKHRKEQGAQLLSNFGEYPHIMSGLQSAVKQFDDF